MKIVNPEYDCNISDESLTDLKFRKQQINESPPPDREEFIDDRIKILSMINDLKIINPVKAKVYAGRLNVSMADLKAEMETLSKPILPDWQYARNMMTYRIYAYQLWLYSADKIQITENGLELALPTEQIELSDPQSPLSESRKF